MSDRNLFGLLQRKYASRQNKINMVADIKLESVNGSENVVSLNSDLTKSDISLSLRPKAQVQDK